MDPAETSGVAPGTGPSSPLDRLSHSTWARLLDLRTYISALFAIFGGVLVVIGLLAPPEDIEQADGININLWTGLVMLALSGFFAVWLAKAPPEVPSPHDANPEDLDPHAGGA